ncbi:Putative deoxyribonuclease YcfH [Lunatimonas lonarensis]|uniref:Putative deoxyribonuclease YcfH n=1 Tax=Lunatimonas lonarensis TaxID=1232681 RepID=R7ZZE0_9BACT|nr:TatD family hydrolase [Lunatimonas lonarensis]EON79419.1 Putative deoxyribonuclease YcfH [Lunatimonas lonarensis]
MNFIDTHAHIYSTKFGNEADSLIRQSLERGVRRIYMPNVDLDTIEPMLALEARFPGVCFPTIGLHPCDVGTDFEDVLAKMEQLMEQRDFVAVGETGIDLYWDKTFFGEQQDALKVQLGWAKSKGWPIILHCRESMAETIEVVQAAYEVGLTGIFHCFSGTVSQAREIMEMGFYLGVGGTVTYKNSGVGEVIKAVGLDAVVLETDAPYLAPIPFRGKRNSPEHIPVIAARLSEIMGCSIEEIAERTTLNALSVFNAKEDEL